MRVAIIGEQSAPLALQLGKHRIRWVVDSQPDTRKAMLWAVQEGSRYDIFVILPFVHGFWDATTFAMCLKLNEATRQSRVVLITTMSVEGRRWSRLFGTQADAVIEQDTLQRGIPALADRLTAVTETRKWRGLWPVDSHPNPA